MKNFRFLSSLAVAGMLTTGLMGTALAATDVQTEPVGVCSQVLANNKKMIPFVLANRDDEITVKDLVNSALKLTDIKVNGTVAAETTVLKTGDEVTATKNGKTETYTIVIYGDVNKDGKISSLDALAIQEYRAQTGDLDEVQLVAGNVLREDGSDVTSMDALHIQEYTSRISENIIDKTHDADKEEEVKPPVEVKYDYTATVKDNNIVNNQNEKDLKVAVKTTEDLSKPKTLTVQIVKEDGTVVSDPTAATASFVAHQTEVEASFGDVSGKLEDGKYKMQILEDDKVVGETEFEVKADNKVALADYSTDRIDTPTASLKAEAYGGVAKKMHYIIQDHTIGSYTSDLLKDTNKKELTFTDNKIDTVIDGLEYDKSYDIYYILEDEYGNMNPETATSANGPITITTDKKVNKATEIAEVTAPDLTKFKKSQTSQALFTWKLADDATGHETSADGKTFLVTLCRDGVPVATATKTGETSISVEDLKEIDGTTVAMTKAGKYTLKVVVKGDDTTTDSAEKESNIAEVTQLKPVSNIKFDVIENEQAVEEDKLTWDSTYGKKDITGYNFEFVKLDNNGKESDSTASVDNTPLAGDVREAVITGLDANTFNKVKITTKAKDTLAEIDSEEAVSDGFFKIQDITVVSEKTTSNSITLKMANLIKAGDKKIDYSVEVYTVTGNSGTLEGRLDGPVTKAVTMDEATGEMVVEGLKENTKYVFKVIANVEGVKGVSKYTTPEEETLSEIPALENLKVLADGASTSTNEISISDVNELSINGETYDLTKKYPAEYSEVYNLINSDDLAEGDTINSYTSEKISVTLGNRAADRQFTTAVNGKVLEFTGSTSQKNIDTETNSATPKEVILKGDGALFGIEKTKVATDGRIVLDNGVKVTGKSAQDVVIAKGASVTLDGYSIKVGEETSLKHTDDEFDVVANNGVNDLEFTSNTGLTLNLTGDAYSSTQTGKITITAKNGGVKVTGKLSDGTGGVAVESDLTITATDGAVEVEGVELTGSKDVKVTKTKDGVATVSVKGIAEKEVKWTLTAGTKLKTYTIEDDEELLTSIGVYTEGDQYERQNAKNLKEFNEFISSFGVNDTGATIETTANNQVVTITFPDEVNNQQVTGIK